MGNGGTLQVQWPQIKNAPGWSVKKNERKKYYSEATVNFSSCFTSL